MLKRRTRTKNNNSTDKRIKIKIEKDLEAEDALASQSIQPSGTFNKKLNIKLEPEENFELIKYEESSLKISDVRGREKKKFECKKCPKSFDTKLGLSRHDLYCGATGQKCEKCGKIFKKEKPFKSHKCLDALYCKFCKKFFSASNKLELHIRNMHTETSKLDLSICDYCGKSFKYRTSLVRHVEEHRSVATFQCPHCDKILKGNLSLKEHIRYIHDADLIKCEICGVVRKRHIMYSHIKYVHSNERNFNCPICDATFKTKEKMKRHVKSHDKKIECKICSRKFVAPHELKEHMMFHENPNAFSCDVCKKSFSSRTCLRTHSKLHCTFKVRNLQCDYCPFITHNYWSIVYHVKAHIKRKERFNSIVGGVTCKICGWVLKKKSLWGHMQIHNAQKMTCDKCGIDLKGKNNFIKHFKLRH